MKYTIRLLRKALPRYNGGMTNSRGNLSEVLRKREEVLKRIREKMPSEADALEALDMAAAALDTNSPAMHAGEYTNTTRAIDALVAHLTKAGRPMKPGRLAKEVASADGLSAIRWHTRDYGMRSGINTTGPSVRFIKRLNDGTITLVKGRCRANRPRPNSVSNPPALPLPPYNFLLTRRAIRRPSIQPIHYPLKGIRAAIRNRPIVD